MTRVRWNLSMHIPIIGIVFVFIGRYSWMDTRPSSLLHYLTVPTSWHSSWKRVPTRRFVVMWATSLITIEILLCTNCMAKTVCDLMKFISPFVPFTLIFTDLFCPYLSPKCKESAVAVFCTRKPMISISSVNIKTSKNLAKIRIHPSVCCRLNIQKKKTKHSYLKASTYLPWVNDLFPRAILSVHMNNFTLWLDNIARAAAPRST